MTPYLPANYQNFLAAYYGPLSDITPPGMPWRAKPDLKVFNDRFRVGSPEFGHSEESQVILELNNAPSIL